MRQLLLSSLGLTAAVCAAIAPKSGSLSNSIRWELRDSVLTISGQGAMPGYKPEDTSQNLFLAEDFARGVNKIVIGEGITEVGGFSFGAPDAMAADRAKRDKNKGANYSIYSNVRTVLLPSTLRKINEYAFARVPIAAIALPKGLESIGSSAFANTMLRTIKLPSGLQRLGNNAFSACEALNVVDFNDATVRISDGCFSSCSSLRRFLHSQSIILSADSAFSGTPLSQLREEALFEMFRSNGLDNYVKANLPDRSAFQGTNEAYALLKANIVNTFYRSEISNATAFFKLDEIRPGAYSFDSGNMIISTVNNGTLYVPVTPAQADFMHLRWGDVRNTLQPTYYPANGNVHLQTVSLTLPDGTALEAIPVPE